MTQLLRHPETGELAFDGLSLKTLAQQFGTPTYVYSRTAIEDNWRTLDQAFEAYPHSLHYAVKANSNLAVLHCLAKLGSGFDIVSGGELHRVLTAGGDPSKVVFSGVAKSDQDINYAIERGVGCFNIESIAEVDRLQRIASKHDKAIKVGVRVNPDVDPKTHPYISTGLTTAKFGIAIERALEVYQTIDSLSHLIVHSVACHIGSQITQTRPFSDALDKVLNLVDALNNVGIQIDQLDLGGGLGIRYKDEQPPSMQSYVTALLETLQSRRCTLPIALEPGRAIVGNAGVLLTRVEYLKTRPVGSEQGKQFCVVDAGMNDLLRPALYQAFHDIVNVTLRADEYALDLDVVGPVCETADVLGYDRKLAVEADDVLAVLGCGAYSFVMASHYNSRPKPCEILISDGIAHCVRQRETLNDLVSGESLLPS